MDRRNALKWMGVSLAAAAMAGIAPLTYSAIIKDRDQKRNALSSTSRPPATRFLLPASFLTRL